MSAIRLLDPVTIHSETMRVDTIRSPQGGRLRRQRQ